MAMRMRLLASSVLVSVSAILAGEPAFAQAPAGKAAVSEIVVTARRLDAARDTIQPAVGASTYAFSQQQITALPGGDNQALQQIILQAPGVTQDSFGQLHVRDDHNGLQYRLNGVILPEGLSLFGQTLSPRLAQSVRLITGALPAQYGLRTAGIVDIRTKTGVQTGGEIGVYGGSQGVFQPSIEYGGSSGAFSGFGSLSWLRSDRGVESPDGRATPLHDRTQQLNGFAYLEDILSDSTRASLILGTSDQRFQIPTRTGQATLGYTVDGVSALPSEQLNEQQREQTHYAIASLLHNQGRFTGQASVFARYSALDYTPDPLGDILYGGIAQTAKKRDTAGGLQAEGAVQVNDAHTIRAGLIAQIDRITSDTQSRVLPVDAVGRQTAQHPLTIVDSGAKTAGAVSLYAQDEWAITGQLTLNYGIRVDQVSAYRDENQVSPRINAVWEAGPTALHAGYARYFSPAAYALVVSNSVAKFDGTSAAAPGATSTTAYAERDDYFDVGAVRKLSPAFSAGLDVYYKRARNLLDEGQFGAPIILTPFNYRDGFAYGVELSLNYAAGPLTAYANLAAQKAQGKTIVSGQFAFDPQDLAYIRDHYIYLDHDQTLTGSAGAAYRFGSSRIGADLISGSGLRKDGAVPNGAALRPYTQINLTVGHTFTGLPVGDLDARIDLVNALDVTYEIRDGTGVGVGAPQFGPRRGVFVGLTKTF